VTINPTPEQTAALELFKTEQPMAIQAGAGTGKTSTLLLLANADGRRGQYLAFNRSIVDEAKTKFPSRVAANTAHSLAMRAEGRRYAHRLKAGRIKSEEVARRLGIDPIVITTEAGAKRLAPGFLAGHVMRAVSVFCQSADEVPGPQHFAYIDGIDLPTAEGHRTYANNHEVRERLLDAMIDAWADLSTTDGHLRFTHDCYLKLWQLSNPTIQADYIMLDEAQDTNPVLLDVFWKQADHAQLVAVGDDNQAIYEWRGAINALGALGDLGAATTYLSQSFRFGAAVADVANDLLTRLDATLRLTGTPTISSVVGPIAGPDCMLTRTNAEAMRIVLEELAGGRRPHLMGGGGELASFARAVTDLQAGKGTSHPELACFGSWGEVQDYVENDQQGDELRLMVKLMDEYGAPAILRALDNMPAERDASVVVSTAHKSKGREWNRVKLGADFPDGELRDPSPAELRLLYVAVTRAQQALDITNAPLLAKRPEDKGEALPSFYADEPAAAPVSVGAVTTAPSGMIGTDTAPTTIAVEERSCPKCGRTDVFTEDGAILYSSDHLC
jgi:hypothetical protein